MATTVNPAALQVNQTNDDNPRLAKRQRTNLYPGSSDAHLNTNPNNNNNNNHQQPPSLSSQSQFYTPPPPPASPVPNSKQVIDLTDSPSPPATPAPALAPSNPTPGLPPDLSPRTPVCIGQLTVTALVLYPVPYLQAVDPRSVQVEWAPVRLQYEHNPTKQDATETVHIKVPGSRAPNGESISGEAFAVVEQKVATSLGPMLGKGLIRLDANVRRGMPNLPILPLQMLVYTPKGNIPIVGNYLHQCGLLLDHPAPPFDLSRLSANYHYMNPHNPPPGGFNKGFLPAKTTFAPTYNRWSATPVNAKSVEVQRSQVDELFKSLKSGDELAETDPGQNVATKLYPHQKKAVTFLLERERELRGSDGHFSSLWQPRHNPITKQISWYHLVTQKEVFSEPQEGKGAILADDMGLGKTITCVALISSTISSAHQFGASPLDPLPPTPPSEELEAPPPSHFSGSVYGMPALVDNVRGKTKSTRAQDKLEVEYARKSRIKAKSRASLIVCPLSTIANWEDQFKEHWKGPVTVVGGNGSCPTPVSSSLSSSLISLSTEDDATSTIPQPSPREGDALRVYIYHGNARRPDARFLADFDVVITTYATLASEFSKQNKSMQLADEEEDDSSDGVGGVDFDERGNPIIRLPKPKKNLKRKKAAQANGNPAVCSALQSVHWFRVVLDEAHCIKETSTVGCRASCDLVADRRLCLTGTPVQNKLDDIFALIKFLRLDPLDDKSIWTEFIGSPVKFNQPIGIARLQTIMKCITLRRTKESKTQDGKKILDLPPRRDELRLLRFDANEQSIYDQFFQESKAEFNDLSDRNEVMKNYVGILQKILRLRQICDHFELVQGKGPNADGLTQATFENISAAIIRDGVNVERANAIFSIFRESATTQCVECGVELCQAPDTNNVDGFEPEVPNGSGKRGRKPTKGNSSRGPTRANSPASIRIVMTRCQHLFCLECFRNCICPGWPEVPPDTYRSCSACQMGLRPVDSVEIKDSGVEVSVKKKQRKRDRREKGAALENANHSTKVKSLMDDLVQFSRGNPYSSNYDPSSVEIQMVDNQGNQLDDGVVKTVVFSQWTSMLDKIEDALDTSGIRYDRLDGTMKRDERSKAMDALKTDPACEVLLVSLKAGGVGLNLTAAQRVYLMDPYWNPAVENQAVDRIHRLGQRRPVTTVKLIIQGTIEAKLLEVQRKKTALANMTFGQNFSKAEMMQRRMEELNELFG